jgi:DNA-binding beta-propeller fold protein YncE
LRLINQNIKLTLGVLLITFSLNGNAQSTPDTSAYLAHKKYEVTWLNQYPPIEKQKNSSLGKWLGEKILGKKNEPVITKPMAILATNPSHFLILDQGIGNVFQIKKNKQKLSKAIIKNKTFLSSLVDFCAFKGNSLLMTDSRLNKIFLLDEEQKVFTDFNADLRLEQPTGIAYSSISKQIWVVETAAHRIAILNEQGLLIRTIGKRGMEPGEFNFPTSISIDDSGRVYVVDALNNRIQVFDKSGDFISTFGEIGNATGYFARPKGIATDSYGHIYVTDALFHTVQVFDIKGNFLYQFGVQGRGKEQFWMPAGLFIDPENNIYVADSYNSRIQIFKLVGK